MVVYFIANYTVTDQAKYDEYSAAGQGVISPLMATGQAKMLVYASGDGKGVKEGVPQDRLVVIEFESREIAENWYNSEGYSSLIKMRQDATENAWVVITDKFSFPS
jgi:uncharacterized protein (DUF1330 family)